MDTIDYGMLDNSLLLLGQYPAVSIGIVLLLVSVVYRLVSPSATLPNNRQYRKREQPRNGPSKNVNEEVSRDGDGPRIEALKDFDWKATEPATYLPIKPVYHITMALQNDTPSDLITIDRDYLDRVSLRRALIEKHGSGVHGCLPNGKTAVDELYTYLLRDYLPTRYPSIFRLSGNKESLKNLVTGKGLSTTPPEDPTAALRALGETVEEDLFLLHETPDGHLCVAFMCCFPSGFDPSQKSGNLLKDIHQPVPSYSKIGSSMERFFSKMRAGKPVKRLNWSIQTHADLYNCQGNHITDDAADIDAEDIDIDQTYFRVELQTLTRLPKTNALLFSFKTYLYGIRQIKQEGSGPELADAIEGLRTGNAPGMWRYKSAVRWGEPVCRFLRA